MNKITNFSCRFCDSQLDTIFLDLGITPSANSFLKKENLSSEKSFPLRVFVCNKCLLVQLPETIDPNELFSDYAYFSSFSETWLKHAEDYVDMMINRFDIKHSSQIMEIASNDGYLLKNFVNRNIPVLGIEPASNVADTAIKNGIPTLKKFFSVKTANEIKEKQYKEQLINTIEEGKLKVLSDHYVLSYDGPTKFYNRRNEILIQVNYSD